MTGKTKLEEAEFWASPNQGYFQKEAIALFEEIGMDKNAKELSYKYAKLCLKQGWYALAVHYLKKSGSETIASKIEKICAENNFKPSFEAENDCVECAYNESKKYKVFHPKAVKQIESLIEIFSNKIEIKK
jgi:hypothetical protein